jgi:hypothetical protein
LCLETYIRSDLAGSDNVTGVSRSANAADSGVLLQDLHHRIEIVIVVHDVPSSESCRAVFRDCGVSRARD